MLRQPLGLGALIFRTLKGFHKNPPPLNQYSLSFPFYINKKENQRMKASIYWVGKFGQGRLAIMPRPRSGDWLEDELCSLKAEGVNILVSLLTRPEELELGLDGEGAMSERVGIRFCSFPVRDREVPQDQAKFVELAQSLYTQLAQGKNVAIHCRMGIGRASLLAVAVMACSGIPAAKAFSLVESARGLHVPDTEEQYEWVTRLEYKIMDLSQ